MQLERLLTPPLRAFAEAMTANSDVDHCLDTALIWRRTIAAMSAPDLAGPAGDEAIERILEAAERAADLVMDDADVLRFSWTRPRIVVWVLWLFEYCATGEQPWPLGSLEALLPGQRSRYVDVNGRRLFDPNGAPPSELAALQPYFKWEAEQESGQLARWQGKSYGDGATWHHLDDFLDDLWSTLEKRCAASGSPFGHDPVSVRFRETMRQTPERSTMYKWLQLAKLRPKDIKSGRVTRANYDEIVAK